ncbi:MAG: C-terminal processing peptidase [Bacteroidetes bacterium]|nr:MAG: C-terminal processing peptidase [Bacteroidota bacterium]
MDKLKQIVKTPLLRLLVVIMMGGGMLCYSYTDNYFEVSKNLDIFGTLFKQLNTSYVDEVKPGELMKTGIDAMLESLDPYTNYIPEEDIEDFRTMTTGQYGGVGATVRQKGDQVVISEPYKGFPAQKKDLRAGDIIVEVNGVPAKGKKMDDISRILKGQAGTPVKLTLERPGEKKQFEVTLIREEIKVKSVPYFGVLANNTGYIKLNSFTEQAAEEVQAALVDLKKKNVSAVVFDLRGNPGGLLREAVNIVNMFVDRGQLVVSTKGKVKEWDRQHKAEALPVDVSIPVAVLIDRGSASASEIVSGALQDLDRAVIVGQRSYGKGLVQQTFPLTYNSQMKVTVAKYYIPSGRCIQALDYTHRKNDGTVGKVPDSLITAYKTKAGRTVWDGLGIIPDVKVPDVKIHGVSISLSNKSLIFDFATQYRIDHPTIAPAREFHLTDKDYENFIAFSKDKDYTYSTKSEKAMDDFKKYAEKEKYFGDVEQEFESLKKKMADRKKDDLVTFKTEIKKLLEEEIITRYYFAEGRIEASLVDDPDVLEAVKILGDSKRYKEILSDTGKKDKPKQDDIDE